MMRSITPILHTCAIFITSTLLTVTAMAGERTIIRPDSFQSDRCNIMDSHGNRVGTIEKDALDSRRLQILNGGGELTHIIKPSTLPDSTSRYDLYNRDGESAGTNKKDPLRDDRYRFNGRTIRRDMIRPDRWVIEK